MEYRFLNQINSPVDLKKLNSDETDNLCKEIRDCILNTVSKNGGHLAANLGTVELTVALHKAFESPRDAIIFDVGHQCYTHKLLTGRYKDFATLRLEDGISGFMRPDESEHDFVITGHSSTSVSSAYGISCANVILNCDGFSVAVVGDGALTGGMVYECFNNIKRKDKKLIVVLNDNKMSISKNNGSLSKHLSKIRTRRKYFKFKTGVERFLIKIPLIGRPLRNFIFHLKMMLKNAIYNSNIFESLGFYYMGPIDGHDVNAMVDSLQIAKELDRPVLVHVKTIKGKGYKPAEVNPGLYHGVSSFDTANGIIAEKSQDFSSIFGEELCNLAKHDDKICAITASMKVGTGLSMFANSFKERFFDVGIAEQHAVTFACALAKKGLKPVFAVYSTFLQRAYDQLIHDAAIAELPLTLAIDRAGFVGDDGETHQGLFDVSFLRTIPGIEIYSPASFDELRFIIGKRLSNPKGIAAIRYPKGSEPVCDVKIDFNSEFSTFGEGRTAIVTYGALFAEAVNAVEILKNISIKCAVIKLNHINKMSRDLIDYLKNFDNIIFFEEGMLSGGVAEAVGLKLLSNGYKGVYKTKAVDGFVKQAKVSYQREKYGFDSNSMAKFVSEVIKIGK